MKNSNSRLRLIPYYTGEETLEEVLHSPKSIRLLWLEILFNSEIPWKSYFTYPEVKAAYEKACVWFTHFKTMIQVHTGRPPLEPYSGRIDPRDYRKFLEALNFVSARA